MDSSLKCFTLGLSMVNFTNKKPKMNPNVNEPESPMNILRLSSAFPSIL